MSSVDSLIRPSSKQQAGVPVLSAVLMQQLQFLRKHSLSSVQVLALLAKIPAKEMEQQLLELQRAGHAICVVKHGNKQWSISPQSRAKYLPPSDEELESLNEKERKANNIKRKQEYQQRQMQREAIQKERQNTDAKVVKYFELTYDGTPLSAASIAAAVGLPERTVTAILFDHPEEYQPQQTESGARYWSACQK